MADKMFWCTLDRADPGYDRRLAILRALADASMLQITETDLTTGHRMSVLGSASKVDAFKLRAGQVMGEFDAAPDIAAQAPALGPQVEAGPLNIETGDMVVANPQTVSRHKRA